MCYLVENVMMVNTVKKGKYRAGAAAQGLLCTGFSCKFDEVRTGVPEALIKGAALKYSESSRLGRGNVLCKEKGDHRYSLTGLFSS